MGGITPLEKLHSWASGIVSSRYCRKLEDVYTMCFTAAFALFMFGSAVIAKCKDDQPMWDQQDCHPLAGNHAVPAYIFTMIAPLIPQTFVKGATRWTILACWIFNITFFNLSHVIVGAPLETYFRVNGTFLLLTAICYEHERVQWVVFLLKLQHDLTDRRLAAEARERETDRLMGKHSD